jgi:hypothetical protein
MWYSPDGTVTMVSAMKSFGFAEAQCRTREPGKWPPHLMAVTPGRIGCVVVVTNFRCGVLGSSVRESHCWSSDEMYIGQLKVRAQSRCVVK